MEQQRALDPENAPYMKFVLPIIVEGVTVNDSVNSLKNSLMLSVTNVITPTVGFATTELQEQYIGQGDASIEIPVELDIDNQWDFTSRVVIDNDYIDAYNSEHNTSYLPFPESAIEMSDVIEFVSGNQAAINVKIKYSELDKTNRDDYMLALKLEKGEKFEASSTNNRYILVTSYRMNNRDSWGWEVNSESTQEGALANVYDLLAFQLWSRSRSGKSTPLLFHYRYARSEECIWFRFVEPSGCKQ